MWRTRLRWSQHNTHTHTPTQWHTQTHNHMHTLPYFSILHVTIIPGTIKANCCPQLRIVTFLFGHSFCVFLKLTLILVFIFSGPPPAVSLASALSIWINRRAICFLDLKILLLSSLLLFCVHEASGNSLSRLLSDIQEGGEGDTRVLLTTALSRGSGRAGHDAGRQSGGSVLPRKAHATGVVKYHPGPTPQAPLFLMRSDPVSFMVRGTLVFT